MLYKVLIYSRFPKAMMLRIGERFELMDAAGKPPHEVFTADQLSGIRAMITAGGTPLRADMMDKMPKLGAIVCYGTGYDGVDLAAAAHLAGGPICAKRKLVIGKTVAADASAAGQSRPPRRRLRHGRDRPQDRHPGCGIRDRGRLFQPQQT